MARRATKRHKQKKGAAVTQAQAVNPAQQKRLYTYYNSKVHAINMHEQKFRLTCLLRRTQEKLNLGPFLVELQWQDLSGQAWLSGSMTLQTVSENREHIKAQHGDVVRNEVFWGGRWVHLWDMRIWDPDRILQAGSPQVQANINDDLYLLSLSSDDFHYHDLYCHEILRKIADKYKIPLGKIAMGTYKIKQFNVNGVSPLNAIIQAYKTEKNHTGRVFVMRWQGGKLHITPRVRNPVLYALRKQLVDATVHHTTPNDFATSLTGRSSIKFNTTVTTKTGKTHKSRKVKKNSITVNNNIEAFGYVHKTQQFSQHYNDTELEKATKHNLAHRQQIAHSIDFDQEGIAVIRKGDAVEVQIPEEGYGGWRSVVWVSDITHTVDTGIYTMTPTVISAAPAGMPIVHVTESNPVKSKKKRAQKRKQRKRTTKTAKQKAAA